MISDRSGPPQADGVVASFFIAAAALLLTFSHTWKSSMIAAVLFGWATARYIAVGQAMITRCCRRPGPGQDSAAYNIDQSCAPVPSARDSKPPGLACGLFGNCVGDTSTVVAIAAARQSTKIRASVTREGPGLASGSRTMLPRASAREWKSLEAEGGAGPARGLLLAWSQLPPASL